MKPKIESKVTVTSETIIVSGSTNLEILKPVNPEMTVKMEKFESAERSSEDLDGPIDVNLPGPSHQVTRPRILS